MTGNAAESIELRAFGRSIEDFGELSQTEHEVIAATCLGWVADFGPDLPKTPQDKERFAVRAELVRFLALGGDDKTPVHEKGVRIRGAIIVGDLNLEGCTLVSSLSLLNCELAGLFLLRGARTRVIDLSGSSCRDIDADRVEVSGSIFFRDGFVAAGTVRLLVADITGNLVCDRACFRGADKRGNALSCDEIKIGGSAFLRCCSVTTGSVRLSGAKIVGDLDCEGGHFEGSDCKGIALQCDRIDVGGSVRLVFGFVAAGIVRLPGSKVAADVDCIGGTFGKTASATVDRTSKEAALILERSIVEGTLWLTPSEPIRSVKTTFYGGVSLTSAKVGRIVDAVKEDPKLVAPDVSSVVASENPAFLRLDGFSYDRFGDPTRLTAQARIAFLRLQQPSDLSEKFKPQPWTQMAKVLREMGHEDAARDVAIEQQRASRRAGAKTGPWHPIYGVLYGYGYRPMWLGAWAIGVVLVSAGFFWLAATNGVMGPTDTRILDDGRYAHCGGRMSVNWTECEELRLRYTVFNPLLYSLELAVPIIGAKQTKDWAPIIVVPCAERGCFDICRRIADVPNRSAAIEPRPGYSLFGIGIAFLAFFENLFGWLAGLMFVAVASGLIKKN